MEIKEKIPVMTYSQYRRAGKLVHQCCNYESGNCLALDDGEECVCVQSISYSLLCRWFRAAIVHRRQKTVSDRKMRAACGQLGMKKS